MRITYEPDIYMVARSTLVNEIIQEDYLQAHVITAFRIYLTFALHETLC